MSINPSPGAGSAAAPAGPVDRMRLRLRLLKMAAPLFIAQIALMMQGITALDLRDFVRAVPCVLTIVLMPLTFSISEGLAIGFVSYCGVMLLAGRAREVSTAAWVLGALFLAHLLAR